MPGEQAIGAPDPIGLSNKKRTRSELVGEKDASQQRCNQSQLPTTALSEVPRIGTYQNDPAGHGVAGGAASTDPDGQ